MCRGREEESLTFSSPLARWYNDRMEAKFPPDGFVPTKSAVSGIELFMPAPVNERHEEVVEFRCPQCNGETAFSAADGGLTCSYCGFHEPPPKVLVGKGAEEFEFTLETLERSAHGWGLQREELQCQNCGALTAVPPGDLSHKCPFCASTQVIQRRAPQDQLRPRFLIPLQVDPDTCRANVREWLGSSWMTPGSLRRIARVAEFTAVYIPYWTFDAGSSADWRAQVAHTKQRRTYSASQKRWVTRTTTEWKWESGHVEVFFDDLVVAGTDKLSRLLLERLQKFDLGELVEYDPGYLAGVQAQAYDVQLESAWKIARHQMRERTKAACRSQATSGQMRNFSMQLDFRDESWRYILLPIYVATYRYEGKTYQVMVNGQTGIVAGQQPVDWTKVGLAVGALVAPGLLLGLIGFLLLFVGGIGAPVLAVALVLLVIGVVVAFMIVQRAQRLDDV